MLHKIESSFSKQRYFPVSLSISPEKQLMPAPNCSHMNYFSVCKQEDRKHLEKQQNTASKTPFPDFPGSLAKKMWHSS